MDATKHNPTPDVSSRYGAPMGRPTRTQGDPGTDERPLSLRRIPINSGGYDSGGAYWGLGQPLYWCGNDDGDIDLFFRARDRAAAKAHVRETYPDARFYR